MNQIIDFMTVQDAIHVKKENGTDVSYYIFDEFEIHLNIIAPKSIQEWHFHSQIEETILVTKGNLCCKWLEDGMERADISIRER
jgi:quercetin dioxygenase-like cupin family protein